MSSIQQIAMWLGLRQERQVPISSFAIDSRNVQPGGLFFALPGARVDGHMFLEEVARKGGFAAVVRKEYRGPDFGLVLLKVDDVLAALQEMARAALVERKTKVIGITGSIGKTTTKEFIAEVLCLAFVIGSCKGTDIGYADSMPNFKSLQPTNKRLSQKNG